MRLQFILLFAFSLLAGWVQAQNPDSLVADGYIRRARGYMSIDATQAVGPLDSLKRFLVSHPKLKFQQAEWLKLKGIYHFRKTEYDSAAYCYDLAYTRYQAIGDSLECAKVRVNMSMIFNRKADWDSTILYARDALETFEALGDKKGISVSLNIIGQVFYSNKDYEKALEYFRRYLSNAISANDSVEIAGGYNNIGSCHADLKNYDSCDYYGQRALAISTRIGNQYGIGNAKLNLANNFEHLGQLDKCVPLYKDALTHFRQVGYQAGILEIALNLGLLENRLEHFGEALPYLEEALALARATGETRLQTDALKGLSTAYSGLKDYKNAYDNFLAYHILNDSIYNAENRKTIEEVNARYETERKDREIADLNHKNVLNAAVIERNGFLIFGLVILVILILVAFLFWRAAQRARQAALAVEVERKLRAERMEALIEGQENERKRFAADLHDSIGQVISALQLNLHNLRTQHAQPDSEPLFNNSGKLLGTLNTEIRNTIFGLMPPILDREGLVPALSELAARVSGAGGITIDFSSYGLDRRFTEQAEIALYRVAQEWTSNVVKYAKASSMAVQMVAHDAEIVLTFEDDGQGFSPTTLTQNKGNGWRNIRTRLDLIGAALDLDTAPGRQGSTLIITLPATQLRPVA